MYHRKLCLPIFDYTELNYKQGYSAEEIADQIGHLTLAQVYAALTYYHINREEIDADIVEQEAEGDRIEALHNAGKR
ncbi:MAG: DUF433 domain-containing protein [Scytonema sp. PMC 1069.18]|nr:DUF433 domain-containing protein [Scytonema sp. PMC 1069.18]MEC4883488.1 DUF433 domain-containing protein [Scytonema sp. PMC 1070.18]